MEDMYQSIPAARPRPVSHFRKALNVLGCFLSLPLYWLMTMYCHYPVTLDLVVTIALAELNRFVNEGRRMQFYEEERRPREKLDWEKVDMELQPATPRLDCMAAVVGWREDPALFTRALESYRGAKGCSFLLVGIDGDEPQDEDMVRVFNKVYPQNSQTIHIPEPLGEILEQVRGKVIAMRQQYGQSMDEAEINAIVIQHCIQLARTILERANVSFGGPGGVRQLCIRQRHMHKKGVMLTTFVFALAISDALGIEFLWSSDSDTLVKPDSIVRTVDSIAADPGIGGASAGLCLHNDEESAVAKLASTVYWGELYLTRSTPGSTATSDCQSGPSTVFRLAALPDILVPWYLQTILGKRMIINEDRHLTTNLLARGWGVVFASDVLAETDTPTNLARWLKQQVRWARATHIESLLQPRVYIMSHPLLFYSMAKREFGPLLAAFAIVYYFLTSHNIIAVSATDLAMRVLASTAYNLLRNPHRLSAKALRWVLPGILFYHVPLPAVHTFSMLTLTADGWGTTMRASSERARKESPSQAWWETGFFVAWMGIVAGSATKMTASYYEVDTMWTMTAFIFSVFAASFGAWKMTIDKLS